MTTRTVGYLLAFGVFSITLFAFSNLVPAFSYDEAWVGLFSHRIAHDPTFWPFNGESTYTLALPQYLTALFLKIFGTNISIFRMVGKLEVIAGIALICRAFFVAGETRAALIFPLLAGTFPAIVTNHRWTVELTTFSVLCTGLFGLGFVKRWKFGPQPISYFLMISGAVLGITSHVLLFSSLFSVWYCLYFTENLKLRSDRWAVTLILGFITLFLLYVYQVEDRHLAIGAIIGLTLAMGGFTWFPFLSKYRTSAFLLPSTIGSVLLIPFFVYSDGNWLAKQFVGFIENPFWIGTLLAPVLLSVYFLCKNNWNFKQISLPIYTFLPLTLIGTYAMAARVGARYLEIPFLYGIALLSLGLSRIPNWQGTFVVALWMFLGCGELWQNYFKPCIEERQIRTTYRLGRLMKDSSDDFLPKVTLARRLGQAGCTLEDLEPNSRSYELQFMSLGTDWPLAQEIPCKFGHQIQLPLTFESLKP